MLELKNITHFYSEKESFRISDITMKIAKGEFLALLGPNGSGKSTLLKIMAGNIIPRKGHVLLNSKEINTLPPKERAKIIAYVPQNNTVAYPFTIREIVTMGRNPYLNYFGYETEEDRAVVDNAMELLDIKRYERKPIFHVSGGEAQRAFIARALAQEPDILLLDEANAHLDVKHQIAIYEILKKLNGEKGLTVVFVSHDLNLPAHFSQRVILLKEGKIVRDGGVKEVLNTQNIEYVFGVKTEIIERENLIDVLIRP
jgi:iron complex transport system ATP-binding protein